MDFVTHLPWTSQGHDVMWVIVDQLTKSAYFLVVRMNFTLQEFCGLLKANCASPRRGHGASPRRRRSSPRRRGPPRQRHAGLGKPKD